MQNDRKISIATGASRRATIWNTQTLMLSELWEKLKVPARGTETLTEYFNLKKAEQDELKDVGGFVGGTLNGARRKSGNVTGRDIITLDLDNIPIGHKDDVLRRVEALGCGYCVYSTRKHQPAAPRLRVLLPLDRTVTADEYEPLARKAAEYIGLEFADPTTFEPSRLMYWPSCCSDSEYVYVVGDKPFISADGLLAQYADWHDIDSWPALPGQNTFTKLAVKQGDPESKSGIVGAFCRTYDIRRAMDELLPGIYESVDNIPDRYTYLGGSTTGGAVLYEGGKFLYSHHATDPCSGKLVNAFDLVRLHKFGDRDDNIQVCMPSNRLPSYAAMCEYARELPEVVALIAKEDFADINKSDPDKGEPVDWTSGLTVSASGGYEKTLNNIMLIIQNVAELHGCARKDEFSDRIYAAEDLPWRDESGYWSDSDTTELRKHFEIQYKFRPSKQDLKDAVVACAVRQRFHPVRDYLLSLSWDGQPRLDTLFADYLGVADNAYTRAVTRKALVGAVARVMTPGCKFDYMPIFVGKQGRNKSTIISKLAGKEDWFSDSMVTFDGKNAFESITGKWLVEVPEMHAFDKATMNQAKAFLSKQSDFYRAAYAEFPEDRPRQCIFFGTTNNAECLRDETGGRRFWPLDIDVTDRKKSVFNDLDSERDQIWAEAVVRWKGGEPLYLPADMEREAARVQEEHREFHPWTDTIANFLSREVPIDWENWDLMRRKAFWDGSVNGETQTMPRQKVCVKEIWQECLGMGIAALDGRKSREITAILTSLGWEKGVAARFGNEYGVQKSYVQSCNQL
ncbi:MAG: virulence-associated protein E [Clostridiales bacterium]|nr:virulence-associated protein E [Clostridiales bacterium]